MSIKQPKNQEIKSRFFNSFYQDFYPDFYYYCSNVTYKEGILHDIVAYTNRFNFTKKLKDAKPKKPLKLALSGIKAGVYDEDKGRIIRVVEYVFRNIARRQTDEGWCQYNEVENCVMLKIPFKDRRLECWIVFFLHSI